MYVVKTLKEFQYIDEYGKDQGANGSAPHLRHPEARSHAHQCSPSEGKGHHEPAPG